ncbi:PREDICTED: uncharacterized protein LOC102016565 [Chinchilla lanigera]|uniref:uncharacterized protein LOC102016565 n=1 Tax=Chinchilla lanigera TaxID=34839 RepID=UPI00038EE926|nr:PREDICTED: uncharacterized protein LOC102016565 [Chinchilla lanigera]
MQKQGTVVSLQVLEIKGKGVTKRTPLRTPSEARLPSFCQAVALFSELLLVLPSGGVGPGTAPSLCAQRLLRSHGPHGASCSQNRGRCSQAQEVGQRRTGQAGCPSSAAGPQSLPSGTPAVGPLSEGGRVGPGDSTTCPCVPGLTDLSHAGLSAPCTRGQMLTHSPCPKPQAPGALEPSCAHLLPHCTLPCVLRGEHQFPSSSKAPLDGFPHSSFLWDPRAPRRDCPPLICSLLAIHSPGPERGQTQNRSCFPPHAT